MSLNKTEALRQAEQYIVQGNVSSAIALYRRVLESDPLDLSSISALGDLYVKSNRLQDAGNHFFKTAENYLKKGSTNSAIYLLTKILKFDPLNAQVYMKMGEIYARDGVPQKAHDCFIEAGAAFWQNGNAGAAREANQHALRIDGNSRQAKAALQALLEESRPKAPEPQPVRIAGDLAPIMISIPDESKVDGGVALASAAPVNAAPANAAPLTPGPEAEADELLSPQEPFRNFDEKTIIDYLSKAELLVAYGRIDEALATLREFLKHKPDDIEIRIKLKDVYLRGERIGRAAEECINIAGIYLARGDTGRAKDYLIRADLLERALDHIVSES
jgi:tetratricopeptide (TPR) repeat protein